MESKITGYTYNFWTFLLYFNISGPPVSSHLEFRTVLQIILRNFINWCQKGNRSEPAISEHCHLLCEFRIGGMNIGNQAELLIFDANILT